MFKKERMHKHVHKINTHTWSILRENKMYKLKGSVDGMTSCQESMSRKVLFPAVDLCHSELNIFILVFLIPIILET